LLDFLFFISLWIYLSIFLCFLFLFIVIPEMLQKKEQYKCEKCKNKVDALKIISVIDLPEILCLHIKRFGHSEYFGQSKIDRAVVFQPDLDMTPYLYQKTTSIANVTQSPTAKSVVAGRSPPPTEQDQPTPALYNLRCVVTHLGGSGGGHYVAFAKHHVSQKWYCFNDDKVSEVSEEKVHSKHIIYNNMHVNAVKIFIYYLLHQKHFVGPQARSIHPFLQPK
jgi:ubiquitin C-terminal hydrolase